MESHTIRLRVTDPDGRSVEQEYAAVTPYTGADTGGGSTNGGAAGGGTNGSVVPFNGSLPLAVYGVYLTLLSIFGYVWWQAHAFVYAKVLTTTHAGVHHQAVHRKTATRGRR
jgi:hypothetical protein